MSLSAYRAVTRTNRHLSLSCLSDGGVGVIAHPSDGRVRFNARWGFQDLPFDPRQVMIVRVANLRKSFAD